MMDRVFDRVQAAAQAQRAPGRQRWLELIRGLSVQLLRTQHPLTRPLHA